MKRALIIIALLSSSVAQQPQTQTAPLSAVNAKYMQGVGTGYWPTAGSGLTLNVAAGTAFCSGSIATYAGSTLTMTNNTTNYVYLNTGSSCVPAVKTTALTASDVPIATVVTSSGAITSVTDLRTMFVWQSPGTGTVTNVTGVPPIASTGGATPAISLQNSAAANVTSASGNGTIVAITTGTQTANAVVDIDANGNHVASSVPITNVVNAATSPLSISGHTVSCPTCAVGPSLNTVSGIMGFCNGNNAVSTNTTYAAWANTTGVRIPVPFSGFMRDLGAYVSATSPNNNSHTFFFSRANASTQITDVVSDGGRVMVTPNSAAGVYHEPAGLPPYYVGSGMYLGLDSTATNTSLTGPTVTCISWDIQGSGSQPAGWFSTTGLGASTTSWSSIGGASAWSTTEAFNFMPVPWDWTAKTMYAASTATQSNTNTGITYTLRKTHASVTTSTALAVNIPAGGVNGNWADLTDAPTGVAGDLINFQGANSSTATSTPASLSIELVPASPWTGAWFYNGVSKTYGAADNYKEPFTNTSTSTTETQNRAVVPRAMTVQNLYCSYTTEPGIHPVTVTVIHNGSPTSIVATLPAAGGGTACGPASSAFCASDTSHTEAMAQWDTTDIDVNVPAGATGPANLNCSLGAQ